MKGFTLDAGALIAFERNDRFVVHAVKRATAHPGGVAVPAGVLAQVWRDGTRQARLAALLGSEKVEIEVLDDLRAREAGQLCGATGTRDIVDASVVLCARDRDHIVLTSDPDDIRRLDASLAIEAI